MSAKKHYSNIECFDVELKDETGEAWLFVINGLDCWLPKSKCDWIPDLNEVDGTVEIPEWLARKKGIA